MPPYMHRPRPQPISVILLFEIDIMDIHNVVINVGPSGRWRSYSRAGLRHQCSVDHETRTMRVYWNDQLPNFNSFSL